MTKALFIALFSLAIVGCAATPQPPLQLSNSIYTNKEQVIGIYIDGFPEVDTHFHGANCLLCIAAAAAANSTLTGHIQTLDTSDLEELNQLVTAQMQKKGVSVKEITTSIDIDELPSFSGEKLNFAKRDFSSLQQQLNVNKLLVIDLNLVGALRPYNNYFPEGDPVGVVMGVAYIVDLQTNAYEFYEELDFKVNARGEWDEPPSFPGITTAYYQAIELTKDKVVNIFK